jgi:hypothetical protein
MAIFIVAATVFTSQVNAYWKPVWVPDPPSSHWEQVLTPTPDGRNRYVATLVPDPPSGHEENVWVDAYPADFYPFFWEGWYYYPFLADNTWTYRRFRREYPGWRGPALRSSPPAHFRGGNGWTKSGSNEWRVREHAFTPPTTGSKRMNQQPHQEQSQPRGNMPATRTFNPPPDNHPGFGGPIQGNCQPQEIKRHQQEPSQPRVNTPVMRPQQMAPPPQHSQPHNFQRPPQQFHQPQQAPRPQIRSAPAPASKSQNNNAVQGGRRH